MVRHSKFRPVDFARKTTGRKTASVLLLAAAMAGGYSCGNLQAADIATNWSGGSTTDSFWNDSTNWSAGIPNNGTPTGSIYDAAIAATANLPADLNGGSFTVGQLTITATGTVITNTSASAATLTIDPAFMATPAGSTIAGNIDGGSTGGITLTFGSGTAAGVSSTISGNLLNKLALVMNQPSGTLILSGANTYTGATTVSSGTLALTGTGSIATSSGVTIATGATLDISQTTGGTTLSGLSGTAGTVALGSQALTLDVVGTDSFGGVIQDGGITAGTGGIVNKIGAGTEVLTGTNTYTGGTNVFAGTLVAGAPSALASGIVTLAGTPSAAPTLESSTYHDAFSSGITAANPETINVKGYSQDANSTLNLVAFSSSSAPITVDSLAVGGTAVASLNGTANILVVNSANLLNFGQLHDFDTLTIVTSGATPTAFNASGGSSPTASGATPMETGGVTYGTGFNKITVGELRSASPADFYESTTSTGVTVTVQTLFGPDAKNASQQAVGQYLDAHFSPTNQSIPAATKNLLISISSLSSAGVAEVLGEMTPAIYSGLANASIQNSVFASQQVFSEISSSFANPGFNMSGLSLLQTSQQDPFAQSLESAMNSTGQMAADSTNYLDAMNNSDMGSSRHTSGKWSGFAAGELVLDRLPQTSHTQSAQHLESGGVLTGVDYRLNKYLLIGGMFNWMYTGTTLDSAGSRQSTESYSPGVFVGYNQKNIFADAMVAYTYNDYKIDRNISVPNSAATATGEPAGNQYDAATLGGYLFPVTSHLKIGPAGGVGYTHADIAGFSETGSPFALTVGQQHVDSLRSLIGFQGQYTVLSTRYFRDNTALTRPTLNVSLNAYWQHEFLNSGRAITSSINGLGGGSFVYQTGSPSRDSALMGLGVNGSVCHDVTVFANYEMQMGDKKQFAQTVMVGAAVNF